MDDPVDAFPHSAAGAAVLRRLEQRRRRLNKNRTASCSRYVKHNGFCDKMNQQT